MNKIVSRYYYLCDNRNTFSMILVTRGFASVSESLSEVILISVSNSKWTLKKTLSINVFLLLLTCLLPRLIMVSGLNEATYRQK